MRSRTFSLAMALMLCVSFAALWTVDAAAAERTVKFAFHWNTPYAGWSGYYIAREKGYYKQEGVNTEFLLLKGSGAVVQVVGTGEADMGTAASNTFLISRSKGLPLRAVLAYFQTTPEVVLSLKELNLTKPEDFVGKRLATSVVDPTRALFRARLQRAGVDPDKVTYVHVQPDAILPTVLAGRADAATGYLDYEALILRDKGKVYNALKMGDDKINIYGPIILANERFLKANPDLVRAVVRATVRGFLYARDHRDEVVDIFLKYYPEGDRKLLRDGLDIALSLADSPLVKKMGFGAQSAEDWAALQEALLEGKVMEKRVPVSEVFTNEFLPEEAKRW